MTSEFDNELFPLWKGEINKYLIKKTWRVNYLIDLKFRLNISHTQRIMFGFFHSFLSFIYLLECSICYSPMHYSEGLICQICWNKLKKHPGKVICRNNHYLSQIIASLVFDHSLKRIIHFIKYENKKSVAKPLGKIVGQTILSNEAYCNADLIVPVPVHKVRLRERNYNQCLLLCQNLGKDIEIPVLDIVLRIRYTASQTKLSVEEREKNVKEAFVVKAPQLIIDKTVILVDDVITTGSTMNAIAKIILNAGANRVLGLALSAPPLKRGRSKKNE